MRARVRLTVGVLVLVLGVVLTVVGLDAADKWASVLGAIGTLVGLALSWDARAREGRSAEHDLLEQLATEVAGERDVEAQRWGLNYPLPLAVRWSAADPAVMDRISAVVGEQVDPEDEAWVRQLYLSGQMSEIGEVFVALSTRRLVVLGAAGSGKTVVATQLIRVLLKGRQPGQPVPVLLPVASWNPLAEHPHAWIAARLEEAFPALRRRVGLRRTTVAQQLIRSRRILPVLDGLDEMTAPLRGAAVRSLNRVLAEDDSIVLTSRVNEFGQAVAGRPAGEPLTRAAVVELLPLGAEDIVRYLRDATPEHDLAKWAPVFEELRQNDSGALARALSTPLMTSLARTAYSETAADPVELLDERFDRRQKVEEHLLGLLIPTAYAENPGVGPTSSRWSADQAERWLRFLAGHLDRLGSRELRWWQLEQAVPRPAFVAMAGVVGGLGFGALSGVLWARFRNEYLSVSASMTVLISVLALGSAFGRLIAFAPVPTTGARRRPRSAQATGGLSLLSLLAAAPPGVAIALLDGVFFGAQSGFPLAGVTIGLTIGMIDTLVLAAGMFLVLSTADRFTGPGGTRPWILVCAGLVGGLALAVVDQLMGEYLVPGASLFRVEVVHGLVIGLVAGMTAALLRRRPGLADRDFRPVTRRMVIAVGSGVVGGVLGSAFAWIADGSYPLENLTYYIPSVLSDGAEPGLLVGLVMGLMASFAGDSSPSRFEIRPRVDAGRLICRVLGASGTGLLVGSFAGLLLGLVYMGDGEGFPLRNSLGDIVVLGLGDPLMTSLDTLPFWAKVLWGRAMAGAAGGLLVGLVVGVVSEFRDAVGVPADLAQVADPTSSVRADRRATIARTLAAGIVGVSTIALVNALSVPPEFAAQFGLTHGTYYGLLFAIAAGGFTAWSRFALARMCLRRNDDVPWALMAFLHDAYERGLLRRVGPAYQFRHARLQDHLARAHQWQGPARYAADEVQALLELADRHLERGERESALAATQAAVAMCRELAASGMEGHAGVLADALTNLGGRLANVGRWQEARAAVTEAVDVCRSLDPALFEPYLARALWAVAWVNVAGRLDIVAALHAAQESFAIYRRLTERDADRWAASAKTLARTIHAIRAELAEAEVV